MDIGSVTSSHPIADVKHMIHRIDTVFIRPGVDRLNGKLFDLIEIIGMNQIVKKETVRISSGLKLSSFSTPSER